MKCFEMHNSHKIDCQNKQCRQWINCKESQNCTIIAAKKGPMSLQEIGDIMGVTRMRICQMEKRIIQKISDIIK
jgi:DNA-directed RNA polymerase specialized sigma subunit